MKVPSAGRIWMIWAATRTSSAPTLAGAQPNTEPTREPAPLAVAVTRCRSLVAHDESVATSSGPGELPECTACHDVADRRVQRRTDCDELASGSGEHQITAG